MLALIAGLGVRFSQPHLLVWLVAALLPLLLAWWLRERLPQVAFGAMGILREAVRQRQKPWQRASWRLLLQVLFVVLLVAAAARPMWQADSDGSSSLCSDRIWVVTGLPEQPAADGGVSAVAAAVRLQGQLSGDGSLATALDAALPGDVVVLVDGTVPTAEEAGRLWRWVERGGGLILLLGPRTLAESGWPVWQESLVARTGVAVGDSLNCDACQLWAVPALHAEERVPLVGPTAGMGLLPGPTVDRLVCLRPAADRQGLATLASVQSSGLPVAVSAACGRGGVTISALPLSLTGSQPQVTDPELMRWSDLAAWPVFLPYVRGLWRVTQARTTVVAMPVGSPAALGLFLLAGAAVALIADGLLVSSRRRAVLARGMVAMMLVALAWQLTRSPGLEAVSPPDPPQDPTLTYGPVLTAVVPPLCWPGELVEIPVTIRGKAGGKGHLALVGQEGQLAKVTWSLPVTEPETSTGSSATVVSLIWSVTQTQQPGPCPLKIELQADSEAETATPSLAITTVIASRPARLLVLESVPRFEYRFLLQALAADPRLEIDPHLLMGQGHVAGNGHGPAAAIEWSQYDAIWLGDVVGPMTDTGGDAEDVPLDSVQLTELAQEVAGGRLGVAWVPGARFRQAGFVAGTAADWLPVTATGPLAAARMRSPALQVAARPAGIESGWLPADRQTLGEAYELLDPVGLKPTTVVLATAGQSPSVPAIVLGRIGAGQVLGHLSETWRWRASSSPAGRDLHKAYWQQTLIRLATPALLAAGATPAAAPNWPAVFRLPAAAAEAASDEDLSGPRDASSAPLLDHLLVAVAVLAAAVAWWSEERFSSLGEAA